MISSIVEKFAYFTERNLREKCFIQIHISAVFEEKLIKIIIVSSCEDLCVNVLENSRLKIIMD